MESRPEYVDTNARVAVSLDGDLVGTRRKLLFWTGDNTSVSISDNPTDEVVEIQIDASLTPTPQFWEFVSTVLQITASETPSITRVDIYAPNEIRLGADQDFGVRVASGGQNVDFYAFGDKTLSISAGVIHQETSPFVGISSDPVRLGDLTSGGGVVYFGLPSTVSEDFAHYPCGFMHLNESTNKLEFRVMYSDGTTIKTGQVSLT